MLTNKSMHWLKFTSLASVAYLTIAGCQSSTGTDVDDGESGGNGGETQNGGGDAGGQSGNEGGRGGKGGQAGKGEGGIAEGGKGGISQSGGNGQAGANQAGTGGMAMAGGMGGGMQNGGSGTPPPLASGAGVIFSGAEQAFRKINMNDAAAGYAYAKSLDLDQEIKVIEVSDPALPAGTKYALHMDVPTATFTPAIMGFQFRADQADGKWNWFDASAYGGIAFWAKVGVRAAGWNVTVVDASNVPTTDPAGGDCTEAGACVAVHGRLWVLKDNWERVVIPFDDLAIEAGVDGPVVVGKLGRIDLLFLPPGADGAKLWVTGLELVSKQAILSAQL